MIQQSQSWAYIQRKLYSLKGHMHPSVHWGTAYNSQDMEGI